MSSIRATVIVPTYKHQDYLRCSLLSILNSNVPVKLIVVPVIDDESTLECLADLNESMYGFTNVQIIPAEKPDVFAQMQLGLDNVDTEYFTVFGSDDFMLPSMIQKMLSLADGIDSDNPIVGLSFAFTDEYLNITSIHRLKPFNPNKMMKGSYIPDIALVKTKAAKLVGGFQDGHDWGECAHFAFYHRLLKKTSPKVILSPEIGFLYRQLPNSRHAIRYSTKEGVKMHKARTREVARYYWS